MALSGDEKQRADPGLAAVFSFVFSGLGQIYNGEIFKGLCIMAFSTLGVILVIIGFVQISYCFASQLFGAGDLMFGGLLFAAGFLLMASLGIYSIYDAYNTAKKKSEG